MPKSSSVSVEVLSGWKDISAYLGKGVRTVQRYERLFSLPVRRPAGKSRGSVIATKAELDAWIAAAPPRELSRLPRSAARLNLMIATTAVNELNERVNELARLRDETRLVRQTLQESVRLLKKNLRFSLGDSSTPRARNNVLQFPAKKAN